MTQRKAISTEERTALRQARNMNIPLSAEELDDLYSDDDGGTGQPPTGQPDLTDLTDKILDRDGKVNMDRLLCVLLAALGVDVPITAGSDFKTAMCEAAMRKIRELTGSGGKGSKGGSGGGKGKGAQDQGNPLIPSPSGTMDHIYTGFSLDEKIAAMARQNNELRASLARIATPRPLTPAEEDTIAEMLSRMMGCSPVSGGSGGGGGGASLSQEDAATAGFIARVAEAGRGR